MRDTITGWAYPLPKLWRKSTAAVSRRNARTAGSGLRSRFLKKISKIENFNISSINLPYNEIIKCKEGFFMSKTEKGMKIQYRHEWKHVLNYRDLLVLRHPDRLALSETLRTEK